jgi:hypothetical protein
MNDEQNTVTIEMRRDLAHELRDVLVYEVACAEEYYSTEQTMEDGANAITGALEADRNA